MHNKADKVRFPAGSPAEPRWREKGRREKEEGEGSRGEGSTAHWQRMTWLREKRWLLQLGCPDRPPRLS
jgi:hypothetical protein